MSSSKKNVESSTDDSLKDIDPSVAAPDAEGHGIEVVKKKAGSKDGKKQASPKISWYYSVLPYNIAIGPLGTFVQLYILQLYGSDVGRIYVGLVVTAFNAVTIPASMIWGFATDRSQKRKPIVYLSFLALAVNIFAFIFAGNVFSIGVLYCIFSLLSSASATPLNLLIMETEPKPKWASSFAWLSMISSIGVTIGLFLSLGWTVLLPLRLLVIPLAALSLLSGVFAFVLIKEPKFVFEREMLVLHKKSFYERLQSLPMIFLHVPRVSDFRRVFKGLRYEITSYTPVLYMSIFAFYIGSGIFNTSIIPAMYGNSLTESQVFLVTCVVMIVQILAFRFVGPYIEKRTLVRSAVAGLVIRSIGYGMVGVSVFLVSGIWFLAPALIFYPLSSGFAYAIYYTASNALVFNTVGHSNNNKSGGSTLGVYSALVGMASMIGSLISGFTSFYFGFYVTFIIAAFCLAASAVLTSLLSELGKSQKSTMIVKSNESSTS